MDKKIIKKLEQDQKLEHEKRIETNGDQLKHAKDKADNDKGIEKDIEYIVRLRSMRS